MNEVMKVEEVAEYLDVCPTTIRRYAALGKIPARKFGNRWRFSLNEINEWLRGDWQTAANDSENTTNRELGKDKWHSTKETTYTTSTFRSTDEEYEKALGLL